MKNRNVNIELLRIISMLMIVYYHFYVHSQWSFPETLSKRAILIETVGGFGKIGVIIFVLISGYFLEKQSFKIRKIVSISNLVRFYTLLAFFTWLIVDNPTEHIKENLFYAVFPIIFQRHWFVTSYVILILVQPIIKSYLQNEPREKQLKYFCIFLISFFMSGWVGVLFNVKGYFEPSQTFSFLIIALGGHLLRVYKEELHGRFYKIVVSTFCITLILILLRPIIVYYYSQNFAFSGSFLNGMGSLNAILFSMSLFVIVTKINFRRMDWITKISNLTFDIYLIHDNKIFRPLIWTVIFKNSTFFYSSWLPVIVIFEPLLVFMICLGLANIRLLIFKASSKLLKISFN